MGVIYGGNFNVFPVIITKRQNCEVFFTVMTALFTIYRLDHFTPIRKMAFWIFSPDIDFQQNI